MLEVWDWTVVRKVKTILNNIYYGRYKWINLQKSGNENTTHMLSVPREEKVMRKKKEKQENKPHTFFFLSSKQANAKLANQHRDQGT